MCSYLIATGNFGQQEIENTKTKTHKESIFQLQPNNFPDK